MPSPALLDCRTSVVGHFHVITSVAAGRRPLFAAPECAGVLMDQFKASDARGASRSFAWVIMPDHFHWVMQLREGALGPCVQSLKSRSAIAINAALGRRAPVWQRGYYEHWIRDEHDIRQQVLYVMGNPVRAGLASRLGDYPYGWCRWPLMQESQSSKLDATNGGPGFNIRMRMVRLESSPPRPARP